MTWFMAGAATLTVGTQFLGAQAQAGSAIRGANAASKAEGEAIVKERLNKTVANSYATSLAQMQLALTKRQLSQQSADISAAGLAARGNADAAAGATGSVGASMDAVASDITMKADAARQQASDAFENSVQNYNAELDLMVLNTDQSAPTVRQNQYVGPSTGEMFGSALVSGLTQFAGNYAMRAMSLGLGKPAALNAPSAAGTGLRLSANNWNIGVGGKL